LHHPLILQGTQSTSTRFIVQPTVSWWGFADVSMFLLEAN
jgi:hypothetical protein